MSVAPHPAQTPHTVLVVDDSPLVRNVLLELLDRDGIEGLAAENGEQALATLASRVPCLILVDVVMPGIDGFDLCRRVHEDPRTAHVPVVLITGRTSEADVEMGLAAGAVDYIKKPFDRDEVRMRLRTQILLHESIHAQRRIDRYLAVVSEAAKDAVVIIDNAGAIVHWNRAAETTFGYPRHEAIGRDLHAMVAPARYRKSHRPAFERFRTTGDGDAVGQTVELVAVRRDGEEFPVELSLSPVRLDDAWCAVGIVRDISSRKRAEQRALETASFLRTLLDAIPVPIYYKDVDGRYVGVNRALADFYGRQPEDMVGKTVFDVTDPDLAPIYHQKDLDLLSRPGVQVYDGHVRDSSGRLRDMVLHRASFAGPDGEVKGIIGAMLDVTERKQVEAELGHARKLEAVGQLAAGIAHEINTPTQYVGDSVHFLREAFDGYRRLTGLGHQAAEALAAAGLRPDLVEAIHQAERDVDLEYLESNVPDSFVLCADGISRIATIVRAMKEFAHPDQREQTPADLNQALQSTLVIARNEYKYVAEVETDFQEVPSVTCHIGDLNQVFLNLIVNAAHAIGDVVRDSAGKGLIRIATRRDGDWALVEVSDTGTGIPDAIRDRIFDPFFTTKEVGKGSGQGLAIARSVVVDKHGGALTFTSEPGCGTTFTIRLPIDGRMGARTGGLR